MRLLNWALWTLLAAALGAGAALAIGGALAVAVLTAGVGSAIALAGALLGRSRR